MAFPKLEPPGIGEIGILLLIGSYIAIKFFPLPLTIAIVIFALTRTYFKLRRQTHYWRDRGIQGPIGNLFMGSTFAIAADINKFDGDNFAKYGDPFGSVLNGYPDVVTKDVNFIKTVFNAEFDAFTDREPKGNFFPEECLFASWVTLLKGDDWKRVRQRLTPAFTTAKMRKLLVPMEYCAKELVTELDEHVEKKVEIDIKDLFGKLTMNVIGRAAFAFDLNTFNKDQEHPFVVYSKELFQNAVPTALVLFVVFFPNVDKLLRYILGWKITIIRNSHDFFTETVTSIVDQRINSAENAKENIDALQLLINAMESDEVFDVTETHEDSEFVSEHVQNAKMIRKTVSKKEIVAQMTLFLIAGYETTASTLQFTLYCMANYPEVQEKARAEVLEVFDDKETLTFDDIAKLSYLKQVIYETLRMFPPVPRTMRTCNRPIRVYDIDFEPGCTFSAQIWHVHYDENNYPEPQKFDPERFSPEGKADRDPGAFLPFGGGPRSCIGMRFAEFEMLMTLAHLLRRFRFSPSAVEKFEWPVPLNPVGLTRPAKTLMCRVESL
uniref:Cytochrome P450 n=1 Tax=Panagrellus redivivus TaxID=6233 RepID=A0A7E4VU63_PANRE